MISRNPNFSATEVLDSIILKTICPFCGKERTMTFKGDKAITYKQGAIAYQAGYTIQTAWPTLTPAEREFILTGICSKCWNSV